MLPPDNPWPVVFVFICVAIGFGLRWTNSGKKSALAVALIALGLGVGCYAWSQSVETPTKVIVKLLHEMTAAFKNQDIAKTKSYFSRQANLPPELDTIIQQVQIRGDLRLTDIAVRFHQQNSLATSHFRANGSFAFGSAGAVDHFPTRWELDWQREANEWKIVEVRRLHLMNGTVVDLRSGK